MQSIKALFFCRRILNFVFEKVSVQKESAPLEPSKGGPIFLLHKSLCVRKTLLAFRAADKDPPRVVYAITISIKT